jgi:Rrf2 family protein
LIRSGILNATEGARGGVTLAKSPAQISVWDIVYGLQGDIKICNSSHSNGFCKNQCNCVMRKKIIDIEKLLVDEFHKITIQSLLDEAESSQN